METGHALIFFKHGGANGYVSKLFANTYDCGWLIVAGTTQAIVKWGNCKDREAARAVMKDTFKRLGKYTVLLYDNEIAFPDRRTSSVILSDELYSDIMENAETWESTQSQHTALVHTPVKPNKRKGLTGLVIK